MSEGILRKINDRRERLADIDSRMKALLREKEQMLIEISIYEDALSTLQSEQLKHRAPSSRRNVAGDAERRPRSLKVEWAELLRHLGRRHPYPFSLDDLVRGVPGGSFHPTRGNVRSQMAQYVDRGLLERVSEGRFRLTHSGFLELGLRADEVIQEAQLHATSGPAEDDAGNDEPREGLSHAA